MGKDGLQQHRRGEETSPTPNPPAPSRPVPTDGSVVGGSRMARPLLEEGQSPGRREGQGVRESVGKANKEKEKENLRQAGPCRVVCEPNTGRWGFGSSYRAVTAKRKSSLGL